MNGLAPDCNGTISKFARDREPFAGDRGDHTAGEQPQRHVQVAGGQSRELHGLSVHGGVPGAGFLQECDCEHT